MRLVDRLVRLWTVPLPDGDGAVSINGADVSATSLLERAQSLQGALSDLRIELIEEIETPDRLVIVFWQRGRHVGTLETPLGRRSGQPSVRPTDQTTARDRRQPSRRAQPRRRERAAVDRGPR